MSDSRPNRFFCKNPGCGGKFSYILKTKVMESGIRRVRKCTKCGELTETFERKTALTKASDELKEEKPKDIEKTGYGDQDDNTTE